jgi:hypothetical protein
VENLRNSENRQILQRRKKDYGECFSKCRLRRNWVVGSEPTRAVGSLAESHFMDSRVEGLKPLHQDS